MSESAELELWRLMRGALTARALGIAADLDVAGALGNGPLPVAELARSSGVSEDALRRVLRALASEGVFAEVSPGVFRNTDTSELLARGNQRAFAHLFGGVFHRASGELDASGSEAFSRTFGRDYWTWLAERPQERAMFDRAMAGGAAGRAERLASVTWRGDETVVDVGGGNGSSLMSLLERVPTLHGIVFDLPETVRDESALGERIEFVAGSFFERVPPGDVYVLSGILHDWNDERAAAILRAVRAAAPDDGRLLILDAVLAEGNEPHESKWLDLLMLALVDGRERDEKDWRTLLAGARFEPTEIRDGLIEATCR